MQNDILKSISEFINNESIEFSYNTKIANLGLNSISFINLVLFLEDKYNIEFQDEFLDFSWYKSIEDFVNYVCTLIQE